MYYSDLYFYATSQSVSQSEIDCRNREMLSNEQIKGKAFENIDFFVWCYCINFKNWEMLKIQKNQSNLLIKPIFWTSLKNSIYANYINPQNSIFL